MHVFKLTPYQVVHLCVHILFDPAIKSRQWRQCAFISESQEKLSIKITGTFCTKVIRETNSRERKARTSLITELHLGMWGPCWSWNLAVSLPKWKPEESRVISGWRIKGGIVYTCVCGGSRYECLSHVFFNCSVLQFLRQSLSYCLNYSSLLVHWLATMAHDLWVACSLHWDHKSILPNLVFSMGAALRTWVLVFAW